MRPLPDDEVIASLRPTALMCVESGNKTAIREIILSVRFSSSSNFTPARRRVSARGMSSFKIAHSTLRISKNCHNRAALHDEPIEVSSIEWRIPCGSSTYQGHEHRSLLCTLPYPFTPFRDSGYLVPDSVQLNKLLDQVSGTRRDFVRIAFLDRLLTRSRTTIIVVPHLNCVLRGRAAIAAASCLLNASANFIYAASIC